MTFFLDHDMLDEIAKLLRHWGHSVTLLREVFLVTATDEEAFNYSCEQKMLLITYNRDDFLRLAKTRTWGLGSSGTVNTLKGSPSNRAAVYYLRIIGTGTGQAFQMERRQLGQRIRYLFQQSTGNELAFPLIRRTVRRGCLPAQS